MSPLDWQMIAVILCVAGAAFVVTRRAWRMMRPSSQDQPAGTCGSCGNCGATSMKPAASNDNSFVPIDSLTRGPR
jgi:hypothetical protein